ncbi:MAG: PepSY domain-containing protein [Hyphomicrobiaceae bacterium]
MMKHPTVLALGGVAAIMLAVIVGPRAVSAGSPEQCIGDWAQAATIVQKRKMVDVAKLSKLAKQKFDGRIMSARLCTNNGAYFYRLVIRRNDGRMQRVKVDAQNPGK